MSPSSNNECRCKAPLRHRAQRLGITFLPPPPPTRDFLRIMRLHVSRIFRGRQIRPRIEISKLARARGADFLSPSFLSRLRFLASSSRSRFHREPSRLSLTQMLLVAFHASISIKDHGNPPKDRARRRIFLNVKGKFKAVVSRRYCQKV